MSYRKSVNRPDAHATIVQRISSRRRFEFVGCCAMALAMVSPTHAADADGDGIDDQVEGFFSGLANGFETPVIAQGFRLIAQEDVPDWSTTAVGGKIELWQSGFRSVPSFSGSQHAELNGTEKSTLFVDVASQPGSVVTWQVAHRGREGTDTATVSAGAPDETDTVLETMATDDTAWVLYSGSYTVPAGQSTTRFSFNSLDDGSLGNFIDGFELTSVSRDTDEDGTPDHLDNDADGDGIPDARETALDADGDGTPNYLDLDSDADNIDDAIEGNIDSDGDGEANFLDTDSDNDGLPDIDEGNVDADGDGQPDFLTPAAPVTPPGPADTDADSIPDSVEGTGDSDGDGVADRLDLDSDNDGIPDANESSNDRDGDGVANYLDLDSDEDGISDLMEARVDIFDSQELDADLDGVIDGIASDFGVNGLAMFVETTPDSGQINYQLANGDGDGRDDYLDLDSDNDSIADVIEMRLADDDLNGVVDSAPASYRSPPDQDFDDVHDFRDIDSDNDGLTDLVEAQGGDSDSDNDGRIDNFNDTDNDGVDDAVTFALPDDTDADGLQNQLDLDSDQDSLPDLTESGGVDADGNGLVDMFSDANSDGLSDDLVQNPVQPVDSDGDSAADHLDLDSDNDGMFDLVAAGNTDTDNNGQVDSFVDPDNDGLVGSNADTNTGGNGGGTPDGGLITGVSGGAGCSLIAGRVPADPLFPGMLLMAGLGLLYGRKNRPDR